MSETITGIAVKSIDHARVTEDGGNMLLTYTGRDERQTTLAIPAEELEHLLLLGAEGLSRSQKRRNAPVEQRRVVEAKTWGVNETVDKKLVLSLWLQGGAELSFLLPLKGHQEIYALGELLRRASEQKDATEEKPTVN